MKAARRGVRRFAAWARRNVHVQKWTRRFVAWLRANLQEWVGFGLIVAACWQVSEMLALLVAGFGMLADVLIEGYLRGRS